MHRVLRLQLRKLLKAQLPLPDDAQQAIHVAATLLKLATTEELREFLTAINDLQLEEDKQNARLNRALQISNEETIRLNSAMKQANVNMQETLRELETVVRDLAQEYPELAGPSEGVKQDVVQMVKFLVQAQRDRVQEQDRSRRALLNMMRDIDVARRETEGVNSRLSWEVAVRKKVEEELRSAHQVVENSPAVLFRWKASQDRPVEYVSENVRQFGYDSRGFLSGTRNYLQIVHPEDRTRLSQEMEQFSGSGLERFHSEYRLIASDGQTRWVDERSVVEHDSASQTLSYQGIVIDITERRMAEENLRKLSLAVEQSPVSIVVTNTNGDIEYVNPKFQSVTGYLAAEVIGHNPRVLKSGQQSPEFYRELWDTLLAGREWRGEFCNKKKNGELFWESAFISPITNSAGQTTHYLAVKEDITERRAADERIRQTKERVELLLRLVPSAIFSVDSEQRITSWNRKAEEVTGYAAEEVLGKHCFIFSEQPCKTRCGLFSNEITKPITCRECTIRCKDGRILTVSKNCDLFLDADGNVMGGIESFEDITERKAAEQAIKQRDLLLEAVATASNHLLTKEDFFTAVNAALETLGRAAGVDRIHIYENQKDARNSGLMAMLRFEWCSDSSLARIGREDMQGVSYEMTMPGWVERLSAGKVIKGPVDGFTEELRRYFEDQEVVSVLVVPIMADGQFWGFVSFHDCHFRRTWAPTEISILLATAGSLGSAFVSKRAQMELRSSEQRLRTVVSNSPVALFAIDENGVFAFADGRGQSALGLEPRELVGRSAFLLYRENTDLVRDFSRALAGETFHAVRHVGDRYFENHFSPMMDDRGSVVGAIGVSNDITDRRLAEKALRESEARVRAIVNTAADGIITIDDQGLVQSFNPSAERIFGYTAQEVIGQRVESLMRESVRPLHTSGIQTYMDTGKCDMIGRGRETFGLRKDGIVIPLELSVSEVELGGRKMFAGIVRDITERRRAAEELAQAREREVQIGARIQQALLLGKPPEHLTNIGVWGMTIPSQRVDGDFYDFVEYDDKCLDVVIGDVMGKGIAAAMLGAAIKSAINRAITTLTTSLAGQSRPTVEAIIKQVHSQVSRYLAHVESFVTLCYARINLHKMQLEFVDCGHTGIIYYSARDGQCRLLTGSNMPLGFSEKEKHESETVDIENGDVLFLYSDGITEARDSEGAFFGPERLIECVGRNSPRYDAPGIVTQVRRAVEDFVGVRQLDDDLTCLAVRIGPPETPLASVAQEFPSDMSQLSGIRDFVTAFCESYVADKLGGTGVDEVVLAINEVATNVVRHAYRGETGRLFEIRVDACPSHLTVRFSHDGPAYEPLEKTVPKFDGTQEGGFGLYIIENMVDTVLYSRDNQGRNGITLSKYFL